MDLVFWVPCATILHRRFRFCNPAQRIWAVKGNPRPFTALFAALRNDFAPSLPLLQPCAAKFEGEGNPRLFTAVFAALRNDFAPSFPLLQLGAANFEPEGKPASLQVRICRPAQHIRSRWLKITAQGGTSERRVAQGGKNGPGGTRASLKIQNLLRKAAKTKVKETRRI